MSQTPQIINCPKTEPFAVCFGHGACNTSTGKCICEVGWTSRGDFFPPREEGCNISLTAITILWAICLVGNMPLLYVIGKFIQSRLNSIKSKTRPYSDPTYLFVFFVFLQTFFQIFLSCLKLRDPEEYAVGGNPVATFAFASVYHTVTLAICYYQIVLIKFLLGYAKMMSNDARIRVRNQGDKIKKTVNVFAVICALFCFVPYLLLIFPQHPYEVASGFFAAYSVVCSFFAFALIGSFNMIVVEITSHISKGDNLNNNKINDLLNAVKISLNKGKIIVALLAPGVILMYALFIIFPLLSRNSGYVWPVLLTSFSPLFYAFIRSLMNKSTANESSEEKSNEQLSGASPKIASIQPQSKEGSKEVSLNQVITVNTEVSSNVKIIPLTDANE